MAAMNKKLFELAAWIREHDDFVVIGHVSPDGDAAGSCMALKLALDALGKRACVVLPGGLALRYAFLPHADEFFDAGDALPFAPKTAIAVDVADEKRLGAAHDIYAACEDKAVLDHHASNPGFALLSVVGADCAAAGELVLQLIGLMGVQLTAEMAECLFVAISTDSGNFNFQNTTPDTLCAAADCVAAGADVEKLTRILYRTRRASRTKLLGTVLADMEVACGGKLVYARVTEEMFEKCSALREDTDGIVNFLVEVEGAKLAFLAEQRGEATKFSLRSVAPYDVAADVAVPLGGGGHERAAGVTLQMPMEEAVETIRARMQALIEGKVEA